VFDVVTGTALQAECCVWSGLGRSDGCCACAIWLQTCQVFSDWMHQWLTVVRVLPCSKIKRGAPTPMVELDLSLMSWFDQVAEEIEQTRMRLQEPRPEFRPEEMAPTAVASSRSGVPVTSHR